MGGCRGFERSILFRADLLEFVRIARRRNRQPVKSARIAFDMLPALRAGPRSFNRAHANRCAVRCAPTVVSAHRMAGRTSSAADPQRRMARASARAAFPFLIETVRAELGEPRRGSVRMTCCRQAAIGNDSCSNDTPSMASVCLPRSHVFVQRRNAVLPITRRRTYCRKSWSMRRSRRL